MSAQNPFKEAPLPPSFSPLRRRKRLKIDVACDRCRTRKVKCDGARPACGNCSRKLDQRDKCHYDANSTAPQSSSGDRAASASMLKPPLTSVEGRSNGANNSGLQNDGWQPPPAVPHRQIAAKPSSTSLAVSHHLPSRATPAPRTSEAVDSMTAVGDDSTTEFFGSSSAGSFTAQIKAAVDARLGNSPISHPGGTQGSVSATSSQNITRRRRYDPKNVLLPARRVADELMRTYWLYIDPLYPFLNKEDCQDRYSRLFAGQPLHTDESVFMASLNIVFALSTQLHEGQDATVRNDTSLDYFQRAQDLVDVTIWDPGSLETVQYLLITSQYLQSTNSPHQTWMVVSLAVRTAQSLGLHLPDTSTARPTATERELYRQLWHGCVLMDRMVALTHGRPAMISHELAGSVPLPTIVTDPTELSDDTTDVAFFVKSVELYEITHRLAEKLYAVPSEREKRMKASQRAVRDMANIVQIDGDMTEWERSLPGQLRKHSLGTIAARPSIILQLRFLHARILLLRPILSLVCLPQSTEESDTERLANRLHKQCAMECVATARATIQIFYDHQVSDGTVGLLPAWWYRLYYLFSASTVLIAAKLRPDVFPSDELHQSWEQSVHVFEALQKVSQSAQKCVAALRILSTKILSTVFGMPQPNLNLSEQQRIDYPKMSYDFTSSITDPKIVEGFDMGLNFGDINFDVEIENYAWLKEVTSWNFLSA